MYIKSFYLTKNLFFFQERDKLLYISEQINKNKNKLMREKQGIMSIYTIELDYRLMHINVDELNIHQLYHIGLEF
jgi:hypothetical protein